MRILEFPKRRRLWILGVAALTTLLFSGECLAGERHGTAAARWVRMDVDDLAEAIKPSSADQAASEGGSEGRGAVTGPSYESLDVKVDSDYYAELYRPQYHFTPPEGRLADPNGLVYFDGEYHLFYQKMGTWAHAVSRDLVHWEHLPTALDHDELGQALSGSVVVDWKDSTGFFGGKPGLVAIYTSTAGGQAQSLAYSKDRGRTWKRYEGNPVIPNPGVKDFRDPKVFWHEETGKWVMVVSTNQSVTFYNSDNLIDWHYLSRFGDGHGSHVAVWECPDLFRLPVDGDPSNQKWVLHVSVGDNDITHGSTAQYFIGDFDGVRFINEYPAQTVLFTDYGQDFYAAQTFSDIPKADGRRIWIGWMSNWRYPYEAPTHPWKGAMSIPRVLSLRTMEDGTIRLVQKPVAELKQLRSTHTAIEPFRLGGSWPVEGFSGSVFEFDLTVAWEDVSEFGIRLRKGGDQETVVGVDVVGKTVFVDRSKAGLPWIRDRNGTLFRFGRRFEAPLPTEKRQIRIHGFVDESSVEIFVNDGEIVFTNLVFTRPTNRGIELYAKGGTVEVIAFDLYHLRSSWRPVPSEGGVDRIVWSTQGLNLRLGAQATVEAAVKPDWLAWPDTFQWQVDHPEIVEVLHSEKGRVVLSGLLKGATRLRVVDSETGWNQSIPVWVD